MRNNAGHANTSNGTMLHDAVPDSITDSDSRTIQQDIARFGHKNLHLVPYKFQETYHCRLITALNILVACSLRRKRHSLPGSLHHYDMNNEIKTGQSINHLRYKDFHLLKNNSNKLNEEQNNRDLIICTPQYPSQASRLR